MRGGHLLDDMNHNGEANLMTDIMMEGTASKTLKNLKKPSNAWREHQYVYQRIDRRKEIPWCVIFWCDYGIGEGNFIGAPWDEEEFARIKTATINQIKRSAADPNTVARICSTKSFMAKPYF